jgi:hypothetical protein
MEWTDYLASQNLHLRQPLAARVLIFVLFSVLGLILVVALFLAILGRLDILVLVPLVFMGAFFVLYRYILFPRRVRQVFTQQKELSLPIEFEITEAGLNVSNELGSSLRPWKNFAKWKEDKDILMLYQSDVAYTMLPKRFFTDPQQIESIKRHLVQNHVPVSGGRGWWITPLIFLILVIVMGWVVYMNVAYGG